MQKKAITILLLALLLAPTFATDNNPEPYSEPVRAEPVVEVVEKEPTFEEKWAKLTYEEKVEWNPNNCDLSTEILWNSDGTCHPKPTRAVLSAPTGDWVSQCHAWAKMAGIVLDDAAIKLLERESHCNPIARNPHSSAGGIPQALPWTKMGCALEYTDEAAVCQLKWFKRYVDARYGSYSAALAHSYSVGWY